MAKRDPYIDQKKAQTRGRKNAKKAINNYLDGKNPNGAYTSNGNLTQGYVPTQYNYDGSKKEGTGQFTKGTTSNSSGHLAVDMGNGKTNQAKAQTWTLDIAPQDRNKDEFKNSKGEPRKNGRTGTANRAKREYDVRYAASRDFRSEEAKQRLRDLGLTDDEINGSSGYRAGSVW